MGRIVIHLETQTDQLEPPAPGTCLETLVDKHEQRRLTALFAGGGLSVDMDSQNPDHF